MRCVKTNFNYRQDCLWFLLSIWSSLKVKIEFGNPRKQVQIKLGLEVLLFFFSKNICVSSYWFWLNTSLLFILLGMFVWNKYSRKIFFAILQILFRKIFSHGIFFVDIFKNNCYSSLHTGASHTNPNCLLEYWWGYSLSLAITLNSFLSPLQRDPLKKEKKMFWTFRNKCHLDF